MGILEQKKKKIVLLNYPLGLPLLNIGMCGYFGTKKKSGSNRCNPLNSSIDIYLRNRIIIFKVKQADFYQNLCI